MFVRLGGEEEVARIVETLYRKCENDERVSRFFNPDKVSALIMKQKAFSTVLFGGPHRYTGKGINAVHRGLVVRYGLSDQHFDTFGELLLESLCERGVNEDLLPEISEVYHSWKDVVLSRGEWSE